MYSPIDSAVNKLLCDGDFVEPRRLLTRNGPHSLAEETVCDREHVRLVNYGEMLGVTRQSYARPGTFMRSSYLARASQSKLERHATNATRGTFSNQTRSSGFTSCIGVCENLLLNVLRET